MKIKNVIFILALSLAFPCYTQNVTQEDAEMVAKNFRNAGLRTKSDALSSSIERTLLSYYEGEPSYYVVSFKEGGYVIVSAYDGYEPVLMYTDNGEYDEQDLPPSFIWWMDLYSQRIQELSVNNVKDQQYSGQWALYRNNQLPAAADITAVAPLLTSRWDQGSYYKWFVNDGGKGSGCSEGKCAAGCVAIAGSQVFRYWGYPVDAYDWCNMPDELDSSSNVTQITAVARLIADVGADVGMSYCSNGCSSGAVTADLRSVFARKGYAHQSYTAFASNGQILQKIKSELDEKRPLITRGTSTSGNGHAFVFDGYDVQDRVHINWGWGGAQDGYFYIDNHNYTGGQAAIFGVTPTRLVSCLDYFNIGAAISQNPVLINQHLYNPGVYGVLETANTSYPASYRTIHSGKNATYTAYKEVILAPGFSVEVGGTLSVYMTECPVKCSYPNY